MLDTYIGRSQIHLIINARKEISFQILLKDLKM